MEQTRRLEGLVSAHPELELLAPVSMNIVCFRYQTEAERDWDVVNTEILLRVQEAGEAMPSSALIEGRFAIRACNVNHRCEDSDVDALVEAVVRHGRAVLGSYPEISDRS
jgi:glutamate/tyrosine decarboxylase-like PLP-dependent enzyme